MENELIKKYLAACKLAGMEQPRLHMVETVLNDFAEYCEKQEKAKKQKMRLISKNILENGI